VKSVFSTAKLKSVCHTVTFACCNLTQKQRDLENRLDKSNLKCREAEHIQKTYLQIKIKLEDEQKSFGNTLDGMEHDIVRSDSATIVSLIYPGLTLKQQLNKYTAVCWFIRPVIPTEVQSCLMSVDSLVITLLFSIFC